MNGERIHESLGTTDWQKGLQIVREWEASGSYLPNLPTATLEITLEEVWKHFLVDLAARNLQGSTIRKYRLLCRQMEEFAHQRRLRFIRQFDLPTLSEFRAEWQESPLTRSKKLERMRALFRFAQESNWVNENPALKLK
jgi:site-specific recombinase XerD